VLPSRVQLRRTQPHVEMRLNLQHRMPHFYARQQTTAKDVKIRILNDESGDLVVVSHQMMNETHFFFDPKGDYLWDDVHGSHATVQLIQ
jgi:hypothetical protein